ncbi:DUF6262 family protein [Antrihabitans stalactiti]|uniref:Transposase n=1 Tax=Antrihabitans stalactiti TaxID=2584121 RepID=A0A848KMC5_9NOCA|nr:DUF6262 family protein [Antrihabitans stalactiti]NMN99016.1 hypothetical protein [Antrihabitans stalactiti]
MPDSRADKLIAARKQASRDKHKHTLITLNRLLQTGTRISFAGVAREAGVSTWLLYNNSELKQAITTGMQRPPQPLTSPPQAPSEASANSMRADLELARHEITVLRRSERKLRERLQRTLGAEIEQIDRADLIARITDLETVITTLRTDNIELAETNGRLTELTARQHDELDTANTLLRRYMKEASRAHPDPARPR